MGAAAVFETAAETPPTVVCQHGHCLKANSAKDVIDPFRLNRDGIDILKKSAMKGCAKNR